MVCLYISFFFFKQKTAYEVRISDWISDVCSSDLVLQRRLHADVARVGIDLRIDRRNHAGELPASIGIVVDPHGLADGDLRELLLRQRKEIGRASCRERVCRYV